MGKKNRSFQTAFLARVKERGIDTALLQCTDCRTSVRILIGKNIQFTEIIVDVNHDNNFTNDSTYRFANKLLDTAITETDLPTMAVPVQYCLKNQCTNFTLQLTVSPFKSAFTYAHEKEQRLPLSAIFSFSRYGTLPDGRTIWLNCGYPDCSNKYGTEYRIADSSGNFDNMEYLTNDYFSVGNKIYRIGGLDKHRKHLLLYPAAATTTKGFVPPLRALPFSGTDLVTGKKIDLTQYRGRYLLIDYWGSWCAPCLANIPKLKAAAEFLRDKKVSVLGIAVDKVQSMGKLKQIIADSVLTWPHIFQDMDDLSKAPIAIRYRIHTFPTYLLIGPDGRLLMREIREEGLDKIFNWLERH